MDGEVDNIEQVIDVVVGVCESGSSVEPSPTAKVAGREQRRAHTDAVAADDVGFDAVADEMRARSGATPTAASACWKIAGSGLHRAGHLRAQLDVGEAGEAGLFGAARRTLRCRRS